MKTAYLILAHKYPDQVIRLIRALRSPDACFVLHIDARSPRQVFEPLVAFAAEEPTVLLAPPVRCHWGTYSLVEATLGCVRSLFARAWEFDYAVLLSGQHFPIKSPFEIQDFFEQHRGCEFIMSFPLDSPNSWTGLKGRFEALSRIERVTVSMRRFAFQLPWLRRKVPFGWRASGGSQWWCLSRSALEWVESTLAQRPELTRFFRNTSIPDEIIFQTMLTNSPFADRISPEITGYVDWRHANPGLPRTLTGQDFSHLAASPALFARKFEPEKSANLLERIESQLLEAKVPSR